jgi:hypothetical protein
MQPARCFPAECCWHVSRTVALRAGFLSLSLCLCLCPKWIDQGVSQILPVSARIIHPHVLPKSTYSAYSTLLHTLQGLVL